MLTRANIDWSCLCGACCRYLPAIVFYAWMQSKEITEATFGYFVAQWSVCRYLTDLWLTGDHFVGKLSTMGQPSRTTQPSIPRGR